MPIQLRLDELTSTLDFDMAAQGLEAALQSRQLLPAGASLPQIWPSSLPAICTSLDLSTAPQIVDLNPADPVLAKKFALFKRYRAALQRIEVNALVVRLEQSTANVAMPALRLQAAVDVNAAADDDQAWVTLGTLPGASLGEVIDLPFTYAPGGESFLEAQLLGAAPRIALRTRGLLKYDTDVDPLRPGGMISLRIILATTFFVALDKL